MTAELAGRGHRERRLANLRATLARAGGAPAGPDQRAGPGTVRRTPQPGARGAARGGARGGRRRTTPGGWLVAAGRAARGDPAGPGAARAAARATRRRTRRSSASTRRRPGSRPPPGRSRSSSGSRAGTATTFRQTQLLLPDHADEPALLAEIARWVTPGRVARDLQRPRVRLAADRGAVPARRPAGAGARRAPGPAAVRPPRVPAPDGGRAAAHRGGASCWASRASATSRAGRSRGSTSTCCGAGPIGPLAGVVIHNEKDVRSLGLLLAHVEHRYADRGDAPRRAARGPGRAWPGPTRGTAATTRRSSAWTTRSRPRRRCGTRSGGRAVAPAVAREASHEERDDVVVAADPAALRRPRARGRVARRAGERARRAAGARRRRLRPGTRPRTAGRTSAWPPSGHGPCGGSGAGRRRPRRGRRRRRPAAASGAIAWIEVAKLREHRLRGPGRRPRGDARGLAPAGAAARDRAGAPAPRGGPAAARGAPGGPDPAAAREPGRPARDQSGLSPPCMRRTASARYGTP